MTPESPSRTPGQGTAHASSGTKGAFVWGLAEVPVLDLALRLLTSGDSQKRVGLQPAVAKVQALCPCLETTGLAGSGARALPAVGEKAGACSVRGPLRVTIPSPPTGPFAALHLRPSVKERPLQNVSSNNEG